MENPKAILFDLDDTIIEFEVLARPAWKAMLSAMASQLHGRPVEKVRASIGRVSAQGWSDPERYCQGRLDLTNTRQRNVADAFALLGIDDSPLVSRLVEDFEQRLSRGCVYSPDRSAPSSISGQPVSDWDW